MNSPLDLSASINQSICNKLIESTKFPFTAFENNQSFPKCNNLTIADEGRFYAYSDAEIKNLLEQAVAHVRTNSDKSSPSVHDDLYSFGASIIQQARTVLTALQGAPKDGPETYEGPTEKVLKNIIDGGIQNLVETLKPLGDWGIYAWNPHLRVSVRERPEIALNSPRLDLSKVRLEVTATGELWSKYPWLNCYKYCTKWEKVTKCDRIASLTVSPQIQAKLHADLYASGAKVLIRAEFDELRLDYEILNKIPLEGIANHALGDKPLFIYDASQLIATIPVIQTKFGISEIFLPSTSGEIEVGVQLKKL